MEDEDFAVAGGEVDEFGVRIKGIGVHAFADWGSEDYLAGFGIDDAQMLATAADEEAVGIHVHREGGGGAARGEGPAILHFGSLYVNVERFVFLFEIDVEIAFAVGGAVFAAAAECNGAGYGTIGGVEDADAVAFAVHDIEALGERFVDDGVGLLAYFDFGKGFERFQVEGNDGIGFAGGYVTPGGFRGDGYTLGA